MVKQNFAATATYFERRAAKASAAGMRQRLETAASHYRSMAEMYGHRQENCAGELISVPPRRQRLIELFQAGKNGSSLSPSDNRVMTRNTDRSVRHAK